MSDVLFFAGFLVLPLIGMVVIRIEAVQRMSRAGRIAVAGAAGAVIVALSMALLSLIGIGWNRTKLLMIFIPLVFLGVRWWMAAPPASPGRKWSKTAIAVIAVMLVLTCYGILGARESAGDLQFFWGPKAIKFFGHGGVDVAFLANRTNPNSDYPPLLPLVYAWAHTVSAQFSWWSALLLSLLVIGGCAALARAGGGDDLDGVLIVATFAWTFAYAHAPGGADPPLLFFEFLALAMLTFFDHWRGSEIIAAIALAGAALTKVEGSTFVIAVVIALMLVRRQFLRSIRMAVPAGLLMLAWVTFLIKNNLIFGYGGATMGVHLAVLPQTLQWIGKEALYDLFALPWLVPIALIVKSPNPRAALFPIAVCVLTWCSAIFFYIHSSAPEWWIAASAPRVLLTPLAALLIGAVASWRPRATLSSPLSS